MLECALRKKLHSDDPANLTVIDHCAQSGTTCWPPLAAPSRLRTPSHKNGCVCACKCEHDGLFFCDSSRVAQRLWRWVGNLEVVAAVAEANPSDTAMTLQTSMLAKEASPYVTNGGRRHIDHSSWTPQGGFRGSLGFERNRIEGACICNRESTGALTGTIHFI